MFCKVSLALIMLGLELASEPVFFFSCITFLFNVSASLFASRREIPFFAFVERLFEVVIAIRRERAVGT